MAYRFSHPVPLGTPSLDYGRMEVDDDQWAVTQKGSIWNPQGRDTFTAFWAQDGWTQKRVIARSELNRYKDATKKVYPYTVDGLTQAIRYASSITNVPIPAPSAAPSSPAYAPTAAPSYAPSYAPTAPGTPPPAAPGGSITEQAWFWPAVGVGAIGLVALVWAMTPARTVVRKAASRFMGF
jgi:hypothetical protein